MTRSICKSPLDDEALVDYWLGELDEDGETPIELHLLGCEECSARLAEIVALGDGIRAALEGGAVRMFVTAAFVRNVARRGLQVREYRVPRNGSVNCSVAPEDELLVAHLEAPLGGVERLDAIAYVDDEKTDVYHDIPFDAASGEVVAASKIAQVRTLPSHVQRIRLVAVGRDGERVIGDYTFNHTA
ncbi:MAG: anti-sigma factor family protein [Rudaea sp.]